MGGRWVVCDTAGVGWKITPTFTPSPNTEITVLVTTTWREGTGPELWAHPDTDHRDVFEALCSVQGVGPAIAAQITAALGPAGVAAAVVSADPGRFREVRGVGPKVSSRIIAEVVLPQRIVELASSETGIAAPAVPDELAAALVDLGYDPQIAEAAVAHARSTLPDCDDGEILASALRAIAGASP